MVALKRNKLTRLFLVCVVILHWSQVYAHADSIPIVGKFTNPELLGFDGAGKPLVIEWKPEYQGAQVAGSAYIVRDNYSSWVLLHDQWLGPYNDVIDLHYSPNAGSPTFLLAMEGRDSSIYNILIRDSGVQKLSFGGVVHNGPPMFALVWQTDSTQEPSRSSPGQFRIATVDSKDSPPVTINSPFAEGFPVFYRASVRLPVYVLKSPDGSQKVQVWQGSQLWGTYDSVFSFRQLSESNDVVYVARTSTGFGFYLNGKLLRPAQTFLSPADPRYPMAIATMVARSITLGPDQYPSLLLQGASTENRTKTVDGVPPLVVSGSDFAYVGKDDGKTYVFTRNGRWGPFDAVLSLDSLPNDTNNDPNFAFSVLKEGKSSFYRQNLALGPFEEVQPIKTGETGREFYGWDSEGFFVNDGSGHQTGVLDFRLVGRFVWKPQQKQSRDEVPSSIFLLRKPTGWFFGPLDALEGPFQEAYVDNTSGLTFVRDGATWRAVSPWFSTVTANSTDELAMKIEIDRIGYVMKGQKYFGDGWEEAASEQTSIHVSSNRQHRISFSASETQTTVSYDGKVFETFAGRVGDQVLSTTGEQFSYVKYVPLANGGQTASLVTGPKRSQITLDGNVQGMFMLDEHLVALYTTRGKVILNTDGKLYKGWWDYSDVKYWFSLIRKGPPGSGLSVVEKPQAVKP